MEYPWYGSIEGDSLRQGDLLDGCPLLLPKGESLDVLGAPGTTLEGVLQVRDVVVMSQSCDLEQAKLDLVLVCPHVPVEDLESADSRFKGRGKELLRKGNVPGYHLLAACGIPGTERGIRVVDFRQAHSLPFDFMRNLARARCPRLRLLPPYREHLAQAFARFFMRVGLPIDIPPFK